MNLSQALLAILLSISPVAGEKVREPSTGIEFPTTISVSTSTQKLLGTGVRTKTFFKVKVYAVGLYVNDLRGADETSIRTGRIERSLRLVTARGIGGDAMRKAFEKTMRPRFVRARTEQKLAGTNENWQTFAGFFQMEELDKGSVIVFSCDAHGSLTSTIDSSSLPTIDSEALCWALFDVYLGRKPISKNLKKNLLTSHMDSR